MSQRRWFNQNVPQTLAIAQILLYIDAAFLALDVFIGDAELEVLSGTNSFLGAPLGLLGVAAYVYGAYGIANEQKRGYQVAVAAAFLPLLRRVLIVLTTSGASLSNNLDYIFLAGNVLNVIFEYALIGLLLHPMSRNHQKIWFS
jgi:hypothetical protein